MNAALTREQLQAIAVDAAELLAGVESRQSDNRKRGPWSKSEEGRKRRIARRSARAAKAAWLLS